MIDPDGAPRVFGLPVCTLPNFYISPTNKTVKKCLGTDIGLLTFYLLNKDIKKKTKHFLLPTPLFHKRHFNTKNIQRHKEYFRTIQRP